MGFGLILLPLPTGPAHLAAGPSRPCRSCPPAAQWAEAASHPAIMDTTRARAELGWEPEFTALETLRDTLRHYGHGRGRS